MPKLNYKTLRQEVVDEIRQGILTGDFQAGERIKENEMAQQLGVSRGPVREALRQLEQEGLVQYERNVGCSVAQVSGQDVYEICLLRATLEILAARLLQKGKSVQQALQQMQDCVEQMEQEDCDFYQLAQQDNRFHAAVIEQAGLKKLAELWKAPTSIIWQSSMPAETMAALTGRNTVNRIKGCWSATTPATSAKSAKRLCSITA